MTGPTGSGAIAVDATQAGTTGSGATDIGPLEAHLRERRQSGRKLLVPYLTGGYPVGMWPRLIEAFAQAGADAIEVGIPFSDPVMDGPTIQEASELALAEGVTPSDVLVEVAGTDPGVPLVVMTYYNVAFRMGHERFARELRQAGVVGAILPDLPLEEVGDWAAVADAEGIETVLLAAPTAPDERLPRICDRARGFVYGVGLVGITGERTELASSATEVARRLKAVTDKPVLIGVGVSDPDQAAEVAQVADGVVVGSAIVRRVLEGGSVDQVAEFVAALRAGLDRVAG